MSFWRKRRPEEPKGEVRDADPRFVRTMGIIAPRDLEKWRRENEAPAGEPQEGEKGTREPAAPVEEGMEHQPPRGASSFIPLDSLRVASPCHARWNKMEGDGQKRFCGTCEKHVYDLSAMTREQAQALLSDSGGNLCARFHQRADGTVMTSDCSVGQTPPRRGFWSAASLALLAGASALLSGCSSIALEKAREVPVVGELVNRVRPQQHVMMGLVACPPPTPPPAPPIPSEEL